MDNFKTLKVEDLDFDRRNPRYFSYDRDGIATDVEIVRHLSITADLKELILSYTANGYVNIEPLIVTQNGRNDDKYTVLEGNRRLAVLKLFKDKSFASKCGFTSLPELDETKRNSLENISVQIVDSRNNARALIGFKHINGPQKWDSFAKAQFAKDWYVSEREKHQISLNDIADSLGDAHSTIRRLVFGIFILDQAIDNNLFDIEDRFHSNRTFAFSHLYTSLSKRGFQDFLGITDAWRETEPPLKPVPEDKMDKLKQALLWLYGSKSESIEPVIKSQNPDLKRLNQVLEKPKALITLHATKDLNDAFAEIYSAIDLFERSLVEANKSAHDALKHMSAYEEKDETLIEISGSLNKTSKIIHDHLRNFVEEED